MAGPHVWIKFLMFPKASSQHALTVSELRLLNYMSALRVPGGFEMVAREQYGRMYAAYFNDMPFRGCNHIRNNVDSYIAAMADLIR